MKRWFKWAVLALVVVLLLLGVLRALKAKKEQKETMAQQTIERAQTVVELSASDVVQAKTVTLEQGLPISGPLKAVTSAVVKARVPGELQDLRVREGDAVKAGQVIAKVDVTETQARLRQVQQQAEAAKAQVDIARRTFDNNRSLVEQGFISKWALDSSSASLAAAEANYRSAQAAADVINKSLTDTVLLAPIDGVVSQRLAQPGERVAVDGRIVEIINLSRLELEASLSASESLDVRVGQNATLQVEGNAQPLAAKVVRINPTAVAGSRAVLVYLAVDGAPGLRQGLFVQGTLGTQKIQTLAVPLNAVRTDKPQPYVQLVVDNKIKYQSVQTGARGTVNGETMVAIQGVPEGANVVSGAIGSLRDASGVKFTGAGK